MSLISPFPVLALGFSERCAAFLTTTSAVTLINSAANIQELKGKRTFRNISVSFARRLKVPHQYLCFWITAGHISHVGASRMTADTNPLSLFDVQRNAQSIWPPHQPINLPQQQTFCLTHDNTTPPTSLPRTRCS